MRRGVHDHGGGAAASLMTYATAQKVLPRWLVRWTYHFESALDDAVEEFARSLPDGARVLDAGAGEARHKSLFEKHRYLAVDLAVGDAAWNYTHLDVVADLVSMPLASECCDAAINIVTLEHLPEPGAALMEVARILRPGAPMLIVAPHEWEVHQEPHDYYRYTRYGLRHLLQESGFEVVRITPVGGLFRLLQRRLLAATQITPMPWKLLALVCFAPPAMLLPVFDTLDRESRYTPGYIAIARKS